MTQDTFRQFWHLADREGEDNDIDGLTIRRLSDTDGYFDRGISFTLGNCLADRGKLNAQSRVCVPIYVRPSAKCSLREGLNILCRFLLEQGFYAPVVGISDTLAVVLLRCDIICNQSGEDMIARFYQTLAWLLHEINISAPDADGISIEPQGTETWKLPQEWPVNEECYFQKIADRHPKITGASVSASITPRPVACPFCHQSHTACLASDSRGHMAFLCRNAKCSTLDIADYLTAVTNLDSDGNIRPGTYAAQSLISRMRWLGLYTPPKRKTDEDNSASESSSPTRWRRMDTITEPDDSQRWAIPTGFWELDKSITGLRPGDVTILSGLSGSGKTSWLDCVIANAVDRGFRVAAWSGEMQDFRFKSWMQNVVAGRNVVQRDGDNEYSVPSSVSDAISSWFSDSLFLYDPDKTEWSEIYQAIGYAIGRCGVSLIVIDNLMTLTLPDGDRLEQQKALIADVKGLAKRYNVHVILVCHPRKQDGLLRKESISGSGDLTNMADNVLIIHRVGKDFVIRATEFFGRPQVSWLREKGYDSVIEVCKCRATGAIDRLVGMYYEPRSRRLKSYPDEHACYGWLPPLPINGNGETAK